MNLELNTVLVAFGLTLFAGLSTGIGSLIAWTCKRTNTRFLSVALGFSAGVMIYVSFVEIFAEAKSLLTATLGEPSGTWLTVGGFFAGVIVIAVIDKLVPAMDNPHEMRHVESMHNETSRPRKLWRRRGNACPTAPPPCELSESERQHYHQTHKLMRLGLFTAVAIAIHNFLKVSPHS